MHIDTVTLLTSQISSVPEGCADKDVLTGAVDAIRRVRGWLDACDVRIAGMIAAVSSFPEAALTKAGHVSMRSAERTLDRVSTAEDVPGFGAALDAGTVSGEHLDVLGSALRRIEPQHRAELAQRAEGLLGVAQGGSPDDLGRALRHEARRLETDGGMSRLDRRRRNTRARTWVDHHTGMWHLAAQFDPVTGASMHGRLNAMVNTLFAEQTPSTAPTDPLAKQDHLRALALAALVEGAGTGAGRGRPEVIVVVDTTDLTPDGLPTVDWGIPVEIPYQVLADLCENASIHTVVVRNGVVLHAPGVLDLGRNSRLPNRAQRRALRAMYATCAIPDCTAHFDQCKIHHVQWWRHDGPTDLCNLLPLCQRHHHRVHDDGWTVSLQPDRTLTVTLPDGTTMINGPPRRRSG